MKIAAISFTRQGQGILSHLEEVMYDADFTGYTSDLAKTDYGTLGGFVKYSFRVADALIFVGAVGIAVRLIAPYLIDKLTDPAVIVIDEKGKNIIPILSGHVGGANRLARDIAVRLGAQPIITTATDINGFFAVDEWAVKNELQIMNKDGIAAVSSKLLEGRSLVVAHDGTVEVDNNSMPYYITPATRDDDHVDIYIGAAKWNCKLWLRPIDVMVGTGCKKEKDSLEYEHTMRLILEANNVSMDQVKYVGSIDLKKDETCMVEFCEKYKKEFRTFSAEQLNSVKGDFNESEFVRSVAGTGNICERAAAYMCEDMGERIHSKMVVDGVTVALYRKRKRLVFDNE